MKIKIVQNGEFIFAVKEENIFKEKKMFHNLYSLKSHGEKKFTDISMELKKKGGRIILGLEYRNSWPSPMLGHDKIRKPNIQEYLFLSSIIKQDGLRYNKKKDEVITENR